MHTGAPTRSMGYVITQRLLGAGCKKRPVSRKSIPTPRALLCLDLGRRCGIFATRYGIASKQISLAV